jgi:hypothetical protein
VDTAAPIGATPPQADPQVPPRWRSALTDSLTMTGRSLRLARRNIEAILTSLLLPVLLMLLFVYLFGGAIQTGTRYVTYVVPGVLLLCAGFGAAMTAVSVTTDMTGGIIDRFRSLDVAGAAVLAGHVTASMARNAVSTVLVFAVAFAIGSGPTPARWTGWPPPGCCCCSSEPSPGWRPRSACWPAHPRRPADLSFW